jgi:serine/arginine repetitive matrix protein 1
MDVIKPWIANRVTELLGFEDEVLINFIYGLLDGKVLLIFCLYILFF